MAQHTPGPWTLELRQTFPYGVLITAGDFKVVEQDAFCHSSKQRNRTDNEAGVGFYGQEAPWRRCDAVAAIATQDANARLIAAAPDLLAALKDMLASAPRNDYDQDWIAACIAARAAVAKAEEG